MHEDDEKKDKIEDFVIPNQSPYYLSPSYSPGAIITVIKFDSKNYNFSEQVVRTTLRAKNKLCFIDGEITKPKVNE